MKLLTEEAVMLQDYSRERVRITPSLSEHPPIFWQSLVNLS